MNWEDVEEAREEAEERGFAVPDVQRVSTTAAETLDEAIRAELASIQDECESKQCYMFAPEACQACPSEKKMVQLRRTLKARR
jgi:hypothetical protein